ncbi:hypothetical protein B0H19DRAFT_957773 [Mycena capillaripes]|nr:hypothetical protein B0H19DRAFT_957773 [Mycena capillaripes]
MNSDHNDVPYIALETPPPSPTSHIELVDGTSLPTASLYSLVTPTRRRRQDNNPRKRLKKRSQPEEIGDQTPDWDLAATELDTGSDPVWNSPEPQSSRNPELDATDPSTRDHGYFEYCENVQEEGGAFYQIATDLFVVNGWDPQRKISKTSWYHLQRSTIGDALVTVCQCPLSRPDELCVHQQFLADYGEELFPFDAKFTNDTTNAVLFSRQELEEGIYLNHFSSPSPTSRSLAGRVIIVYTGEDTGSGQWVCPKDSNRGCAHVTKCRNLLQQLVQVDPTATDEGVRDGSRIDYLGTKAVSYLEISPPHWASLDSDPQFYERSPPLEDAPDTLCLSQTSSCCCSEPRRLFDPSRPIVQMQCTVYGLFRAWGATIELQACSNSRCRQRFIGPDGRERGIFNYNNRKLFSHDLLDEYTSAYTSSETPFSAWISVVSRRYSLHTGGAEHPFVTAEVFRAVWFAYVKLQYLEGSMKCPRCGPCPENTIWDGVTLAFNRKHLLPSLEPPTISQDESIERHTTRYISGQQLLANQTTRRTVRRVITGGPLTMDGMNAQVTPGSRAEGDDEEIEDDDDDDEIEGGTSGSQRVPRSERAAARVRLEMMGRLEAIPRAIEGLARVCPALGALFEAKFGEDSVIQSTTAPDVYRRFFVQISAEESVLQMTTKPALDALEIFVTAPTFQNASSLVEIPAIHELLSHEKVMGEAYSARTMEICRWILNHGRTVLSSLIKGPEPPRMCADTVEKPWIEVKLTCNGTKTGCCYGLPKIRERPRYPKLKHDLNHDAGGKRGAKCSKFYSQYGERRLTGGIMCVWCTHSICYGFHCIPRGEGRNDVFSALVTRWETAPKRVIYDFACALGPYCMTREPTFFSNTQFLIDDFHSVGHTKCSPAAFLKTHCNVDPRLAYINSSAGECGNSGLGRIRKSVSYMSQGRAIIYSKVFLCIWNRLRMRKLNE